MNKKKTLTASLVSMAMIGSSTLPAFALSRDETVYSKLNTDGSIKSSVVSEHLKNDEKSDKITDTSDLTDVKNVNGNEKYTKDGDTYTWASKGNDIYYQGKTEAQQPISMNLSYKLDGKDTELKDMLGKKGNVEITVEYTNNVKNSDGLYTPFVVTTGTMIPTKSNSNVKVTNGKVVSNGTNDIVVAIAAPGLYEDFDNNENLKDLNKVTISYTTKKFKLSSMMTLASSKLIEESDLNVFDDMDNIYDLMNTFTSSYAQILSGGKTLQSSLATFASKYSEFDSGVKTAASGSTELKDGAKKVSDGTDTLASKTGDLTEGVDALNSGAGQLAAGANELNEKSKDLNDGAKMIDSSVGQLSAGLSKASANSEALRQGALKIFNANAATAKAQIQASLDAKLGAGVISVPDLTMANYSDTLNGIANTLSGYGADTTAIQTAKAGLDQLVANYSGVKAYTEGVDNAAAGASKLKEGTATLAAGTSLLISDQGVPALLSGANQLSTGTANLKGQVPALIKGINDLKAGANKLSTGATSLNSGIATLSGASTQLKSASGQLSSGATTLVNGMQKFDDEGIKKISNFVNNDLKNNLDKVDTLKKLANEYDSFAKKDANMTSTTKFIMVIDAKSK